jgi:MOSC domain-containing protein
VTAPAVVAGLAVTAIKATRLREVDQIELGRYGVRENRRFYLIDSRGRMINGKHIGGLQGVVADYSDKERTLRLEFPDGRVVEDEIRLGDRVTTRFFSEPMDGRLVEGPWEAALSACFGASLRLVEAGDGGTAVDRGEYGVASLISRASLARLARAGGADAIDARRFRMLIEIDGVGVHEEDQWVGRKVRIGEATVGFNGHIGRCIVTSRDPDSGVVDLPTLDMLGEYRHHIASTEPLPFGIYGQVLQPGTIRVGDEVVPMDSVFGQ